MPKEKETSFWIDFNKFLSRFLCAKLPKIIVDILNETGFENEISLKKIEIAHLNEIEQYVQENLRNVLIGTIYEKQNVFKFLPGHRILILDLPNQVENFIKSKRGNRKQFRAIEPQASSLSNSSSRNENNCDETDKLKQNLTKKLQNYVKKIDFLSISENITADKITKFCKSRDENIYRCLMKCPCCEKSIPCTYNSHWIVSNIEKHIKDHKTERERVNLTVNEVRNVELNAGSSATSSDNANNATANLTNNVSNIPQSIGTNSSATHSNNNTNGSYSIELFEVLQYRNPK